MGCAPSIQVSQTGVIYCRDTKRESPPNQLPSSLFDCTSGTNLERIRCWPSASTAGDDAGGQSPPYTSEKSIVQTLLIFGREDAVRESWLLACQRQNHKISAAHNFEDAVHAFSVIPFDLIVIDARYPKAVAATKLCSTIRNQDRCSSDAVIVAVVKRNFADKEVATVIPLLNAGFSRVLVETNTLGSTVNEVIQLEQFDILSQVRLRAAQAVFTALDRCRDVIHITDAQNKIQYLNRAAEEILGYNIADVAGKSLWEIHGAENQRQEFRSIDHRASVDVHRSLCEQKSSDQKNFLEHSKSIDLKVTLDISEAINMQMRRGKEWEGILTCRRKSGALIHLPSKVCSVFPQAKTVLRYKVSYAQMVTASMKGVEIMECSKQGQQIGRKHSLVKLHPLTIEAPITKVINIITAAQETSPAYVSQALESVLEILRSTELYLPQYILNTWKGTADPVATDLLGALLSQGPKLLVGRRSSNDQVVKISQNPRLSLPSFQHQVSSCIRDLLQDDLTWHFDVIKLEKISDKKPLVWLGMSIMCQCNVPAILQIDDQTLQNWLTLIEANYHTDNTYHNSTHAADVLQTTAYFLELDNVKQVMDPLEEVVCLIAAVVHDVDHPGKNSAFLCNTNNELAVLYNDLSVLESHHAALTFKLTQSDERVNIFKNLDRVTLKVVRRSIIDMVLATDMTKHFEHVSKFVNMISKCSLREEDGSGNMETSMEAPDIESFQSEENLPVIKRMLIKCADVNNPTRPRHLCIDWAERIANEYFSQTEEEKLRNIPVVMPQFDRATCSIPKSQIGFIDFFIIDMFEAWDAFADIPELMEHLRLNYQYWKEEEERERQEMLRRKDEEKENIMEMLKEEEEVTES